MTIQMMFIWDHGTTMTKLFNNDSDHIFKVSDIIKCFTVVKNVLCLLTPREEYVQFGTQTLTPKSDVVKPQWSKLCYTVVGFSHFRKKKTEKIRRSKLKIPPLSSLQNKNSLHMIWFEINSEKQSFNAEAIKVQFNVTDTQRRQTDRYTDRQTDNYCGAKQQLQALN